MTYFTNEWTKAVRECNLEWHCHEVVLSQPGLTDGYVLKGYGTIKILKEGGLYIEFICLESNKRLSFNSPIPEDRLEESQAVVMNARTIDGAEIQSSNLNIETDFQQMIMGFPLLYRLRIKEIEFHEAGSEKGNDDSYLSIEFNETASIPFNKSNTTESTSGSKSSEWNQADIEFDEIKIKIIKHDNYMVASASGKNVDIRKLRDSIVFYIGFSSGVLVQPYFERQWTCCSVKSSLHSIDKRMIHRDIEPPLSGSFKAQNSDPLDHHYELLKNIYRISIENPKYFESIYSQWGRIWHSFFSRDISVPMLTVSIAVDGLLNDIFIPEISKRLRDEEFESEKNKIKEKIDQIENVSEEHLESIKLFIERWGNIHSKKALQYLVECGAIEKRQLKGWENLRNTSAHPKLLVQDERRMRKNIERTKICLGLYYRLALNVFSYKGQQYSYNGTQDNKLIVYEYVEILH